MHWCNLLVSGTSHIHTDSLTTRTGAKRREKNDNDVHVDDNVDGEDECRMMNGQVVRSKWMDGYSVRVCKCDGKNDIPYMKWYTRIHSFTNSSGENETEAQWPKVKQHKTQQDEWYGISRKTRKILYSGFGLSIFVTKDERDEDDEEKKRVKFETF